MKKHIIYIISILALSLAGCGKEPAPGPGTSSGGKKDTPIRWSTDVESLKSATKTLIGKNTTGDYISIEDACTESKGGKTIGFWTDMTYTDENGNEQHRFDVFNANGQETKLEYDASNSVWKYEADEQYWSQGARYNFVAYYPQTMKNAVISSSSSTSVNTFVLSYNTHNIQEDLMVAYNEVCTVDPKTGNPSIYRSTSKESTVTEGSIGTMTKYGFSEAFNLDDRVPLHFRHTMAAIKVQFKFDYTDSDELLECWFENTDDSGLHTVGTLVFGVGSRDSERPGSFATPLDRAEWEHNEKDDFAWRTYQTTFSGVKIYDWGVTGNSGVPFSYDEDSRQNVTATAYISSYTSGASTVNLSLTDEGRQFDDHNGWVMIVPQESSGKATLHYRLKSSALREAVVEIPKYTGTDRNGNLEGQVINGETVKKEDCNHYLPGHRYVYTVRINKTSAYASVSITPWETIYSSSEIIF